MKQFKYRLETVLDYKTQVLDNLKTEHAVIIQNVSRKQEEIRGLHRELAGFEQDFDRAKEEGVSIENYRLFDMCIGRMEEIIDQEKERLKVLRKQEEEKKHPEGEPPLILEKAEGLELIQGEEDLNGPGPEPPHQQEHRQSPREGPQQTPQGALQRAEGVARHDLQGFSGDDGHHDLEDDHAHKEQGTPQTLLVHPAPEPLRLLCELDEGPAGEPARQNREHQKQDNACAHDPSLLPECQ